MGITQKKWLIVVCLILASALLYGCSAVERALESAPTQSEVKAEEIQPFDGPLSVVIYSPAEDTEVATRQIEISGEANPGTVVTLNDEIVLVGPERTFSTSLTLEDGSNLIEITASDDDENQETGYLTVSYEPSP